MTIPTVFIIGVEKIVDFRACDTSREAGVEPPTSSKMLSTAGSQSPPAVLVHISVICENQVQMFYSLGAEHHIAMSEYSFATRGETHAIWKRGAILAEWSSCELKPWWRAHLLNQIKPISL